MTSPVRQALRTSATVDLDAAGAGAAELQTPGCTWELLGMSVETAATPTGTPQPIATIKINGGYVSSTYSGHGDRDDARQVLSPGDVLECSWTGGVAGARSVLRAWGWQYQIGRPN